MHSTLKYLSLVLVFIAMAISVPAQNLEQPQPKKEKSLWKTLGKITYKKKYDELMGFKIDIPVFSDQLMLSVMN